MDIEGDVPDVCLPANGAPGCLTGNDVHRSVRTEELTHSQEQDFRPQQTQKSTGHLPSQSYLQLSHLLTYDLSGLLSVLDLAAAASLAAVRARS